MSKNQRRIYTSEFRASAVKLAKESGQSVAQIAKTPANHPKSFSKFIIISSFFLVKK